MGKIKSKLVRRTANAFLKEKDLEFSEDFMHNKKVLGNNMPSKKVRNQLAGFLSRTKKQERINTPAILKSSGETKKAEQSKVTSAEVKKE